MRRGRLPAAGVAPPLAALHGVQPAGALTQAPGDTCSGSSLEKHLDLIWKTFTHSLANSTSCGCPGPCSRCSVKPRAGVASRVFWGLEGARCRGWGSEP